MNAQPVARAWFIRRLVAVGLLVAFALISSNRVFVKERKRYRKMPTTDAISRYDRRFEPLRPHLPAHEPVGYVGSTGTRWQDNLDPFFATQYALAPVVLTRRTDRPLVVGNFNLADPAQKPPGDPKLQLIEDFGDGVTLFRRAPK
ncbi:MAG TPA: hypothetical protein VJZ71_17260 [Phycisphaerae bacterium]|nr:hypothetical protein [Phycisphaerae bacterium]